MTSTTIDWSRLPNFTEAEMACKCGCGFLPTFSFLLWLQQLRTACGFPFVVTSGGRCPDYNTKVSKTGRTGPHTKCAVDIAVSGKRAHKLLSTAYAAKVQGVGVNQRGPHNKRFVHLDLVIGEGRPWPWSY